MENKYFLHRIQKEDGNFSKGIEVHDTLDAAVLSFYSRMKLGFNNPEKPNLTFISCKITDGNGEVVDPYSFAWVKDETGNVFFMHHIRKSGDAYDKDVDICVDHDQALRAYAAAMEYGFGNTRFPDVSFVSCFITDMLSGGMVLNAKTWNKPEPEPEES